MKIEQAASESMIEEFRRHYRALYGEQAERSLFLIYRTHMFHMTRLDRKDAPIQDFSWEQFVRELLSLRICRIEHEDQVGLHKPINLRFRPRRSCLNCEWIQECADKFTCGRDPGTIRTEIEMAELICDLWEGKP